MKVKCEMCNRKINRISHNNCIVTLDTGTYDVRYFCKENYNDIENFCYVSYLYNK